MKLSPFIGIRDYLLERSQCFPRCHAASSRSQSCVFVLLEQLFLETVILNLTESSERSESGFIIVDAF